MGDGELDAVLPVVDCLLVHFWPERLDRTRVSKMKRLSLVQPGLRASTTSPSGTLRGMRSSAATRADYSDEVGEHAWGLLLSAAKRIVKLDGAMRRKGFKPAATLWSWAGTSWS